MLPGGRVIVSRNYQFKGICTLRRSSAQIRACLGGADKDFGLEARVDSIIDAFLYGANCVIKSIQPCFSRISLSSISASDMDSKPSLGLYPAHHCKTVHLVRHAQGFHNVAGEKDYDSNKSYDYLDASLTPLEWEQVDNLHKHVHAFALFNKIELVIASPLTRTMQTAVGVFGGEGYSNGIDATPLMVDDAWNSGRPAISSFNCPPFLAVEQCREHLGIHPCDKRRSIRENKPLFPAIDFSLIENDDDVLWREDVRETDEEIAARGIKFLEWLWTREEKEIAIVSHSGFLYQTLSAFGNDCHPSVKTEICTHFANCELRSMVLVDRGVIGSDPSATNLPGKVPSGAHLPSDVANMKLEKGP